MTAPERAKLALLLDHLSLVDRADRRIFRDLADGIARVIWVHLLILKTISGDNFVIHLLGPLQCSLGRDRVIGGDRDLVVTIHC